MEYEDKKLNIKDLKQGLVYILKDGRLVLYCGKVNTEQYLFYLVGSVNFITGSNWRTKVIYNFEFMHPYVVNSVTAMMNRVANTKGVLLYKTVPFCIGVYPDLDFSDSIVTWLTKNKMCVKEFSSIVKFTEEKKPQYVKSKELVVGMVYTTASSYNEDYVYLGRDSNNKYCWVYIGNHDVFSKNPYYYLSWSIVEVDKTTSIKKLKGLSKRYPNLKLDMSNVSISI